MLQVVGQVDRGHAAAAELVLDAVAVGQGRLEPFQGLGQSRTVGLGISRLQLTPPPS